MLSKSPSNLEATFGCESGQILENRKSENITAAAPFSKGVGNQKTANHLNRKNPKPSNSTTTLAVVDNFKPIEVNSATQPRRNLQQTANINT